jgi:hypothetical protein
MPEALTRKELDAAGCGMPNCDHDHTILYLHSRCHPSRGADVSYDKRSGHLTIICRACKRFIGKVAVAES